ncbi:RNA polymerase sigma factor [Candidatus Arthromitus sp. SFB-1]|nr:RNA polymerase sigma factor [Candidatus Arthromitus sp. SFB-1]
MRKIIIFINNLIYKFKCITRAIFYIGSSDALPPPLTRDEEDDLINKLLITDTENVRTILIERNLRLVVYIAKKFENTGIMVEDLISVGTIGLIKAVNTFNPDKK